jgi:hypothetical protein
MAKKPRKSRQAQLSQPGIARRQAAMAQVARAGCFLCHREALHVGVFVPHRPEVWGASPGKSRELYYALCRACGELPDRMARVEHKLQAALHAGTNN